MPVRAGEAWRAVTALTLHLDVGHLLSNLGFGTVFGLLAGQLLGPGVAWASVLRCGREREPAECLGAAAGALVGRSIDRGLRNARAARRLRLAPRGRAKPAAAPTAGRRSSPASSCSAFTGVGGESTDVLAHLTGFVMGALAGVLHAAWRVPRGPVAQFVAGAAALIVVAAAWACALAELERALPSRSVAVRLPRDAVNPSMGAPWRGVHAAHGPRKAHRTERDQTVASSRLRARYAAMSVTDRAARPAVRVSMARAVRGRMPSPEPTGTYLRRPATCSPGQLDARPVRPRRRATVSALSRASPALHRP